MFSWERVWCGGVIMLECVCRGWRLLVTYGLMYVQSGYRWWVNLLIRQKQRIQRRTTQPKTPTTTGTDTKWATFTYTSPQIRKITNLFKHTNVKVAFKCNNTISRLTKPAKQTLRLTPYDRNGIYSLTCNTCKQSYVGQTSQGLKLRFQENTWYIKYNNPLSAYVQHILHNQHEYRPMDKTVAFLKPLNNTFLLTP